MVSNNGVGTLRLSGGAGGGKYVPVGDLTPDQLAERRADELRRKQAQRAKKQGLTPATYKEGVVGRAGVAAERRVREGAEREMRAERRREYLRGLASDRSAVGGSGPSGSGVVVPGIGRGAGGIRANLKSQLKRAAGSGVDKDDWNRLMADVDRVVPRPLSISKTYSLYGGLLNKWTVGGKGYRDPSVFLDASRDLVRRVSVGTEGPGRKVEIIVNVKLLKPDLSEDMARTAEQGFRSGVFEVFQDSDFDEYWPLMVSSILVGISKHQRMGSGWVLEEIVNLTVSVSDFSPLSGSSWIELPRHIRMKKAVVNLMNKGDDCFPLSVAAAEILREFPNKKNLERIPKMLVDRSNGLNMGDIPLPMKICDITRFEDLNPGVSVVVYGIGKDGGIEPLRAARQTNMGTGSVKDITCLLFWGDGKGNHHYSPIRRFSALTSRQRTKGRTSDYTCHNCMHAFSSEALLDHHDVSGLCYEHEQQEVEVVDKTIKYETRGMTQTIPFVVYSDIESYSRPMFGPTKEKARPVSYSVPMYGPMEEPTKHTFTEQTVEQVPSGLGYCIVGPEGYENSYRKFDTAKEYSTGLASDILKIHLEWFHNEKYPMPVMTQKETSEYNASNKCYECGWYLVQGENKVRDHDHFTGKFRGAACNNCNGKMRRPGFIPVYFHNLEGYDSHLFIAEIAKYGSVKCLATNMEKYISFSVRVKTRLGERPYTFEIRFLDSFKLMSSSLSSLVSALNNVDDMTIVRSMFGDPTEHRMRLLMKKGVYPYDWVDGPDKLTKIALPPIRDFHNRLTDSECSVEDYAHAQKVWCEFGCSTMQDYHDLYLRSDICQLADVVEKFRGTCRATYKLDPPWYYTTPGLTWDAMLKMTEVRLKTMCDLDIHLLIEGAVRGGISVITKRYSKANHKYMVDYDPSKPSVFIAYLDMNNLYGCAMTDSLPIGKMTWMTREELDSWSDLVGETMGEDTGFGCFLVVDLDYPDEIHDHHSDYPMACENMSVDGSGNEKLVPNLNNKTNYVIHHDELRQCLKHGLILKKIHRGVKFKQSKWLEPYITMNTELRKESTTEFGQDFHKLMNNAVFGKTMENVRGRANIRLLNDKSKIKKAVVKRNYRGFRSFAIDENDTKNPLVAIEMGKEAAKLNKPVYVGAAVLSISKVRMYEFFYEYVKPKWGDRVKLLFTDTDSFCIEVHTENLYADIKSDVSTHFDTSKIPRDHPAVAELGFRTGVNKRVLGMMKDEANGMNISEYVGLRSKMYAIRMEGESKDTMKCKGVKGYVVRKTEFQEYKDCLFERSSAYKSQNTLRSRNHRMYVETATKKALCGKDNKRVIMENGIDTLPWGHKSLREVSE